ncbi:MAG: MurR/RpiR family transcriptional regulator [Erysipelotrichia bacterium]|nr:MurR/RpiR family transcriptional regulator [Erysipelotrichia bacterium]
MDILDTIRLAENITVNENEIREFILLHPGMVLNMTITELAKKSYTSPATVTRFCRKVGTDGFLQMKIMLAQQLSRAESRESEVEKISDQRCQGSSTDTIMTRVTDSTIQAIHDTLAMADRQIYEEAARVLDQAPAIDFFGNGTSNLVAQDAAFKFMRIGKTVSFFDLIDRQRVQALITPVDHVAVIVSYSGESKNMLMIARELRKRKIRIITITTRGNSLSKLCDYHLPVSKTEPYMRKVSMSSRISQLYVVDILFNMCFALHYDEYVSKTEDTIVL